MFGSPARVLDPLPNGHPCQGCEARGQAVCGVLDCTRLAEFRQLGATIHLSAGQTLFYEGDPAARVFTLTSGTIRLSKLLLDGRRNIAGFLFPGDFLGISVDDDHAFSAEAIEDSTLCCFSRPLFDDFLENHPAMEHELYRLAAHELASAQQQLVLLGRKTATERLASFLLILAQRTERATGKPTKMVELPMNRADIADYLGLTKETVSRSLSQFRADRLVRLQALDRVQILDRQALERLAES